MSTTSNPLPADFEELVKELRRTHINHERKCRECGAGTESEYTWLCSACGAKVAATRLEVERADAQRRHDVARKRARATIPKNYAWARFDAPELAQRVRPEVVRAKPLVGVDRIVFIGAAGTGKTSLACALLDLYIQERSADAMFVHAYELGRVRAAHKLGEGADAPLVEAAQCVGLLLLDDVGQERRTELNAVPDVIFERHAEQRPTWITTGLTREQIAERYGDGIARRIFEEGWRVVHLGKKAAQ